MSVSNYKIILDTMLTQIQGLALTLNSTSVPVYIRRLPKKEDKPLDTVPVIVIAPAEEPESIAPFSTENEVLVKYSVDVIFIAANNRDFTDTNLDLELRFREQIRRLFQFGIAGIQLMNADMFFAEVLPDAPLDRDALNRMYDYSGLGFCFWVQEMRLDNEAETP